MAADKIVTGFRCQHTAFRKRAGPDDEISNQVRDFKGRYPPSRTSLD